VNSHEIPGDPLRAQAAFSLLSFGFGRLSRPDRWPSAFAGVDLAELALALEASFRSAGARTQTHPPSELLVAGKTPGAVMASFVLEADRIARVAVTHTRVPPFFAGLALVVHPDPALEAPLLLADLRVLPSGHARALFDAAGPGIDSPSFEKTFGAPLAAIVDDPVPGVRRLPVPAWLAPLSGGGGASLRSSPGDGGALARIYRRYVEAYLEGLARAPEAVGKAPRQKNENAARVVRDLSRSNAPAKRWLTRSFGEAAAERALRLLWREGKGA
jgi:hypothetical protein